MVNDDLYYDWAISIEIGMIIALRTKENKYGLLMITDAKYYNDTIDNYESHKTLVTLKWKYQTDGSRNFSKK